MKKQYDHYLVEEYPKQNGRWGGYKVSVVDSSTKKQGKLYIKPDGREFYKEKPKSEDLEI
jgi:hypothetical protein